MKTLWVGIAALLVGGCLYVLGRTESLLMFVWFDRLGLSTVVYSVRDRTEAVMQQLPQWALYSLPNALWLASGLLVLNGIWGIKSTIDKRVWMFALWCVAIGGEVGQLLQIVPGTFDWLDLGMMVVVGYCVHLIDPLNQWFKVRSPI